MKRHHPSHYYDLCAEMELAIKVKLKYTLKQNRELGSIHLVMAFHLCWLHDFNSSHFFFSFSWYVFILFLHFIWIVFPFRFLFTPASAKSLIQREQEMMSVPRLSGCNQLWLVAAAIFWEEHIKVLLLGVRVGETGWSEGNYILTTSLLPILGEVQAFKTQFSKHVNPEYGRIKHCFSNC